MRVMKDSGVEWIGAIPALWSIGRIGNCYTERKTKVSDIDYSPLSVTMKGIVPQLATAAKTDAHDDRKLVKKGDFAINSRSDRRGSCGISDYDGSVSLINTILQPRNQMNPQYYNWLFHSAMFSDEFYKWGHGIVDDLWTTNWQDMKRIAIPSPPLAEQRRIADFLDRRCAEIDNVIVKTQQTIEEYKKLKQSIITEAVTKGVRGPRPMKDSGVEWIGEIPAEWEIISIGRLFCFVGGYAFSSDAFCEQTNHQVVRMGNIKDDCLVLTEKAVFIDDNYAEMAQSFIIKVEDILFTMTGTKGKKDYFYTLLIGQKDIQSVNLYLNQRVGCFRKNKECSMQYYNYLLKVPELKEYVFLFETGTANQGNLGIATIRKTRLTFPSLEEQNEIADYLNNRCREIDQLIRQKQQLLTELKNYNKSVIYEYVTGKKEVLNTNEKL